MWETPRTLRTFTVGGVLITQVCIWYLGCHTFETWKSVPLTHALQSLLSSSARWSAESVPGEFPWYIFQKTDLFSTSETRGKNAAGNKSWVTVATPPPPGYMRKAAVCWPWQQGLNQASNMTQPSFPEPIFAKALSRCSHARQRQWRVWVISGNNSAVEMLTLHRFNNFKPESQITRPSANGTSHKAGLAKPRERASQQPVPLRKQSGVRLTKVSLLSRASKWKGTQCPFLLRVWRIRSQWLQSDVYIIVIFICLLAWSGAMFAP